MYVEAMNNGYPVSDTLFSFTASKVTQNNVCLLFLLFFLLTSDHKETKTNIDRVQHIHFWGLPIKQKLEPFDHVYILNKKINNNNINAVIYS